MPLLTDEQIEGLATKMYPRWLGDGQTLELSTDRAADIIREAVRLAAERCAAICDAHMGYEMEERAADACAAAIREAVKP